MPAMVKSTRTKTQKPSTAAPPPGGQPPSCPASSGCDPLRDPDAWQQLYAGPDITWFYNQAVGIDAWQLFVGPYLTRSGSPFYEDRARRTIVWQLPTDAPYALIQPSSQRQLHYTLLTVLAGYLVYQWPGEQAHVSSKPPESCWHCYTNPAGRYYYEHEGDRRRVLNVILGPFWTDDGTP